MGRYPLGKEKWTLSFNRDLKALVIREARKRGVYPVALLEEIVRERFNPFGHTDVKDGVRYVRALRKRSRESSDEEFLRAIRKWERSVSSWTRTSSSTTSTSRRVP